jgi:hypothetical protein
LAVITDAIINFFMGLVAALLSFLPTNTPPAWLTTIGGAVGTVYGYAGQMGVWFPVTLVRNVALAVLASILAGFVIKAVRIIASFVTVGGGSAG